MALDFRDLEVYKEAFQLGVWAGAFARQLESPRDWPLADQIIRSSRSVPANIAEAWRKRMYPSHFVSKVTDAEAEAAETQVWLDFAYFDGLMDSATHARHVQAYDRILARLVNLRRTHTSRRPTFERHHDPAATARTSFKPAEAPEKPTRPRQTLPPRSSPQKRRNNQKG